MCASLAEPDAHQNRHADRPQPQQFQGAPQADQHDQVQPARTAILDDLDADGRVQIPEHVLTALRALVTEQFDQLHATAKQERHVHVQERDRKSVV